ncbi:RNA-binding domain-containing protein [Phlegmacium glaucopus]|nr:RNA-binding domain-containing protein [Phlegmacium glaucopus]
MSVSIFANALRTQSRLRVLTAARVALPATRSISSLVAFRTAAPKNVSLSASRLFTTSQVARYESDGAPRNPPSSTIFVANIPWSATEQELSEVFTEFGEVLAVRIHMNSEGRPRGIAHIDFASQDSAVATVDSAAQEPIHFAGRDLRIDFAAGIRERQQAVIEPSEKLYFSGLAGEESDIRTVFQQFGDSIVDIHLLRNPQTGERNPSGFLKFSSTEAATDALEALNGTQTPEGDTLTLSYARPRRAQSFGNSGNSSQGSPGSYNGQRIRKSSPRWNNGR